MVFRGVWHYSSAHPDWSDKVLWFPELFDLILFCGTYWGWSDEVLWFPELCGIFSLLDILTLKWQGFVVSRIVTLFCGTYWCWSDKVCISSAVWHYSVAHDTLMFKWQGFFVSRAVWHYSVAHTDFEVTRFCGFQNCVTLFWCTSWCWSDKVLWFSKVCDIILRHILTLKWQGFVIFRTVWQRPKIGRRS